MKDTAVLAVIVSPIIWSVYAFWGKLTGCLAATPSGLGIDRE